MKNSREYFSFARVFYEATEGMSDTEKLNWYENIIKYALVDDYEPNLKPANKGIWIVVKPILDKSFKNYKNRKN